MKIKARLIKIELLQYATIQISLKGQLKRNNFLLAKSAGNSNKFVEWLLFSDFTGVHVGDFFKAHSSVQ
jgi:hypothetical protein